MWIDDNSLGGSALVGHLFKSVGRSGDTVSFEYADAWLRGVGPVSKFQLDPNLPLTTGRHFTGADAAGIGGVFSDCSPDRWGRTLMKRREVIDARVEGRRARTLRDWDYLLGVNDQSRMGSVRLVDPESARYLDDGPLSAPPLTELRELEGIASRVERIDADDSLELIQWLKQLVAPGASLGGARPKANFRAIDDTLWLAKFPSNDDERDVGLWELLTHDLARAARIDVPAAQALSLSARGHTFAVRRFDRADGSRRTFASAMTLLGANESEGFSYLDIAGLIEAQGSSAHINADLEQLFRRVLFNVLVGNRDDHLRNHGFLRQGNGWRLSPAFDVNPNPDKASHVLAIDEVDTAPDLSRVMSTAEYYRLDKKTATRVADEVRIAVRDWETQARKRGMRSSEIEAMRDVIDTQT